jgi:hypothetical protein
VADKPNEQAVYQTGRDSTLGIIMLVEYWEPDILIQLLDFTHRKPRVNAGNGCIEQKKIK